MTEKFEFYNCNVCGNTIQVLHSGIGELVCCGETMQHLIPNSSDNGELSEKHVPEVERNETQTIVRLSKHPMIPEHYIQFIQVLTEDKKFLYTKFLEPNEVAEFDVSFVNKPFEALELCNIHGLWRNYND